MTTSKKTLPVDITIGSDHVSGREASDGRMGNDSSREESFTDMGVGLFIHWSLDSQLGSVISHWMCGVDEKIIDRFARDYPKLFNPRKFMADDWANLAKRSGMRYMMFTTKHHKGFCMYDTKTTDFNVMKTTFGRDIFGEMVEAFQAHDIVTGAYFSPLDFHWCRNEGIELHFATPEVLPANNPGLMAYNKEQLKEILLDYPGIDMVFFDGPPEGLREYAWEIRPDILVTRGEIKTPEQEIPDDILPGPWEACFTLGCQWNYKATNEAYMSGAELINQVIEIRAKGGNALMNVTADSFGEIPIEQQRLLEEFGLFMFFNQEAIYDVRPWKVCREGDVWFTRAKEVPTVYAFVTNNPWPLGERRELTLKNVRVTEQTEVEIVGQSGRVLEHHPDADTTSRWKQDADGLHLSVMRCYRPYNNRVWPNAIAIRITNVEE